MSIFKAARSNGFRPIDWDKATPEELDVAIGHGSEEYFGNLVEQVKLRQVIVYIMCGGGTLGRSAAEQPGDFYIDTRHGNLVYPKPYIMQAVKILEYQADLCGYKTKRGSKNKAEMPKVAEFHNMGIF